MKLAETLSSLELEVELPNNDKGFDITLDESLHDLFVTEIDIRDTTKALEELDSLMIDAEASIGQLEHIKATIEEFGISGPMMRMADAEGELVEAGIIGSYEDLEYMPVKGELAGATIEGIKETAKKVWDAIVKIIKALASKVADLFRFIANGFNTMNKVLDAISRMLEKSELDEAKLAKLRVNTLSMENVKISYNIFTMLNDVIDFDKLASQDDLLEKLIDKTFMADSEKVAKSIVDDLAKLTTDMLNDVNDIVSKVNTGGTVYIKSTGNDSDIRMEFIPIKATKGTLAELGFKTKRSIKISTDLTVTAMNTAINAQAKFEKLLKNKNSMMKSINKWFPRHGIFTISDEDIRILGSTIKLSLSVTKQLIMIYSKVTRSMSIAMITVGKTALKAKK